MIDATRPGRLLLVITMMLSTFALLIGAIYGMWTSVHTSQWTVAVFLLLLVVFWLLAVDSIFRQIPRIVLSEEGIRAQFLFRKHFFTWQEILQAGILYRVGRGVPAHDFVLLLPGGSPGGNSDKFFLLRNRRRLLHLCASEAVCNFVTEHYGPLDFDIPREQP